MISNHEPLALIALRYWRLNLIKAEVEHAFVDKPFVPAASLLLDLVIVQREQTMDCLRDRRKRLAA